jgi:uncharacterized membrane protein
VIDLVIKTVHVLGAIVLLGTGTGIAFFMLMAHRSGDAAFIARTAGVVVVADAVFTASAGVLQPLTGALLAATRGYGLQDAWFALSLILYAVAGLFWLPVVWMQIRMRDLAFAAMEAGSPLPAEYHRLFRLWFAFGIPGFTSVVAIVWLMVARPPLFGGP